MKSTFKSLSLLAISLIVLACNDNYDSRKTGAFIGGKIINPKTNHVLIQKGTKILDTAYLNTDNQFGYTFEERQEGIFAFKHDSERQIIFIEPKDSMILRLNTYEFDESLIYTGNGSRKNNFLMHMFLLNEENNTWLLNNKHKAPKAFLKLANSMRAKQVRKLNNLLKKELFSKRFRNIAKKSIDYEYYDLKERYYYLISTLHPNYLDQLPKDFFNYRDSIAFNDPDLQYYYGYLRFLDSYIKNQYKTICEQNNSIDFNCSDFNSTQSYIARITLADSIISTQKLKENYIERMAISGIIVASNIKLLDSIETTLSSLKLNPKATSIIEKTINKQRDYLSNNQLLVRQVFSAKTKTKTSISSIIKKPTIIYTWTYTNSEESKDTYKKINALKSQFPNINFIGMNIDDISTQTWLKEVNKLNFEIENQYKLETFRETPALLKRMTKRLLFISREGNVVHRSLNLGRPNFNSEVKKYLLSSEK